MLRLTIALIFFFAGIVGAGCNQTAHSQRPAAQSTAASAPRTGSATSAQQTRNSTSNITQVELANLKAEVQSLDRRVRELNMTIEELTRNNQALRAELERQTRGQSEGLRGVVRQDQLDSAISDLRDRMRQANNDQTRQIMAQVSEQIERLGRQTQAAIDAVARSVSARPSGRSNSSERSQEFSDDFPQTGITYTVRSGDSLSSIASRHNSTVRDIQNANKIGDPSKIQVGQVLFIPQREN